MVPVALLLWWRIKHAYRDEHVGREGLLDAFVAALPDATVDKGPQGLPRLRGRLDGAALLVSLHADTLALRTLPTLRLEARWDRPHNAVVDVMLDPSGTEYFAEGLGLGGRAAPPEGWPDTTIVQVSGIEAVPIVERLSAVDPRAFPALKHILVSRDELRLTMNCARADRQTYRVLRSATFKPDAVGPVIVKQTIDALRTLEVAASGAPAAGPEESTVTAAPAANPNEKDF
ncbi:MAG: hypothetical protein KKA32_03550 [Actinobacteria bacterium]|nr:hypothetical protein [Actinomycetota bacterium]